MTNDKNSLICGLTDGSILQFSKQKYNHKVILIQCYRKN